MGKLRAVSAYRSPAYYRGLFEPDKLDRLELVGSGHIARVLRKGRLAIKVPHPFNNFRSLVDRESAILEQLGDEDFASFGIPVPELFFAQRDLGLVRAFVEGPSLAELLRAGPLPKALLEAVFRLYLGVERYRARFGTVLDFTPANLFVQGPVVYLIDPGPRIGESPFIGLMSQEGLLDALVKHAHRAPSAPLPRRLFPPSGRFSVGVQLGRDPGARVAFKNDTMLKRWGLEWSEETLLQIGGWSTEQKPARTWMPASRYQDSPGTGEGHAQGDGRCVYAGEVPGGEVMLKGVGPTPLVWRGVKYHQDGRVSLNRTLWETSICDELARLGFETPEVAGVLHTSATTVDNSEIELPAAVAIRVARSHDRLGHLLRFCTEPGLEVLLEQVGRRQHERFSPRNKRHRRRFVQRFAQNLGRTIGRTHCLNIMAFNPTVGNVRTDGHLLDFSTVRFLDRTYVDWRFMESSWTTKDHRYAFWKAAPQLVEVLARGLSLVEAERSALLGVVGDSFKEAYERGYLEELFGLLGAPAKGLGSEAALGLLRVTVQLRAERDRSGRMVEHRFWRQRTRAPCFALETQLPVFVRTGRVDDLLDPQTKQMSEAQRALADRFGRALQRCFGQKLGDLEPRVWTSRVRPFMEAERLAALVYERSAVDQTQEWQSLIKVW